MKERNKDNYIYLNIKKLDLNINIKEINYIFF